MNFVEDIGVGEERAETGYGAEQNRPPAVLGAGIILRIGITEDPPAEGDKWFVFLGLVLSFRNLLTNQPLGTAAGAQEILFCRLNFCDEHFEGTDRQSARWFRGQLPLSTGKQDAQVLALEFLCTREIQLKRF